MTLREEVARAIRDLAGHEDAGSLLEEFSGYASDGDVELVVNAAIAVVLERAAKVADSHAQVGFENERVCVRQVAIALRPLAEEQKQ